MKHVELSIVIPAFNEENSLPPLLEKLLALQFPRKTDYEIIVVDDASTDLTYNVVEGFSHLGVKIYRLEKNSGKGAAVSAGIAMALGKFCIVQDADLEYDPDDIPGLLGAAQEFAGVTVYGSRVLGAKKKKGILGVIAYCPGQALSSWAFNIVLSAWVYALRRIWITDTLTGYKLYPMEIFDNWSATTKGFETDHEITSRILNRNGRILEIPISYTPRTKKEGKKIRAVDGLIALRTFWIFRK
jgi:dolichol-phosphate mannosyltransferase